MGYIEGHRRDQILLFPEAMEEYISEDHPVRFIDAFVESLEMGILGFHRAICPKVGRSPYDPKDMIRLYIYGYLNRIRSSRCLEKESHRNLELMWLLRKLQPDFKTIADFRKDNGTALRNVCRQFIWLCRQMELFGGELVAIDGSKFKAVNSLRRSYTQRFVEKRLQEIEAQIQKYLEDLEHADTQEAAVEKKYTREQLQEMIQDLQQQQGSSQKRLKEMETQGKTQVCLTDEDSRVMPNHGRKEPCYNVQTVVDAKYKLIVTHEVTQEASDTNLLTPMALEAKEVLGVETLGVVADKGYYNREQVQQCQEKGITCYIPLPKEHPPKKGLYTQEQFVYDVQNDCYRCPAGEVLTYQGQTKTSKQIRYHYRTKACEGCPLKAKCTTARQRNVYRTSQDCIKEALRQRMKKHPEMMQKRKCLSEHPFGSLKQWMNQGYFLTRKLEHVQTEMSLSILAYNLKRVMKIIGVKDLLAAFGSVVFPQYTLLKAA